MLLGRAFVLCNTKIVVKELKVISNLMKFERYYTHKDVNLCAVMYTQHEHLRYQAKEWSKATLQSCRDIDHGKHLQRISSIPKHL